MQHLLTAIFEEKNPRISSHFSTAHQSYIDPTPTILTINCGIQFQAQLSDMQTIEAGKVPTSHTPY